MPQKWRPVVIDCNVDVKISKNISNSVFKIESDIEMTIAKLTNDMMHYIFFIDI